MENTVTIQNTKENTIEFELNVEGIDGIDSAKVSLVVETQEAEIGFRCRKEEGNKWSAKIPMMSQLEKTTYPFHISVVIDGYYFEPTKGLLNIVASAEVYTNTPQNVSLKPNIPNPILDQGQKQVASEGKDSAEKIANKIMSQINDGTKKNSLKEERETKKTKSDKIASILEDINVSKPKTKQQRFTFKKS